MTKAVFRPGEIALANSKIVLTPPFPEKQVEVPEQVSADKNEREIFIGPSAAELQMEAERRRAEWETERQALLNAANVEAKTILQEAQTNVSEKIKAADIEALEKQEKAKSDAEHIIAEAEEKAKILLDGNTAKCEAEQDAARAQGLEKGREEGYAAGLAEVQRLVVRTQVILERLQDKRAEILAEAEQQIIDLVLLISRKIVKTISETERTVVIENIREALSKVKNRGKITIKVNLADLQATTAHLADFTKMVESAGTIQILEDTSIDAGGCAIETDFGEIDARITNQLAELEARILEVSPIKSKV